ncbi:hypothetical protein BU23DRAFT_41487 [Bimuria novae-zelandiae CBS 107.79]|uniref:N-acetyltransferase domain-containing protein n=1 Tax=Bimuria novae-zelandiae CBS 107.79 TaxID=1447943 RepID=A0A6A5UJ17_9PLEO|nr:hypothetical protein BU23DRAFT_41487 [Bimuria novae-zelandiae CBS 107.79]
MPLVLCPITERDTLAWTRIRTLAYYGPLHVLIHTGTVSQSSIRSVADDRKNEIGNPNTWHWKVIDTNLPPGDDDPEDNGGRTIAIAVWSAHNLPRPLKPHGKPEDSSEAVEASWGKSTQPCIPPELRLDVLTAVLEPLRAAQHEIMGKAEPYLKLDSLVTHPEHHRRGAGRMLLEWGLNKADEEGCRIYLDATPVGLRLYKQAGFQVVKEVTFDMGKWGGAGTDWWACMVREARDKP